METEIPTCPGCQRPAHATETDDDGYHPGCRPATNTSFTRIFNEARKAQGFRSQAHLDAFFASYDHTKNCADCKAKDGGVWLDDGWQPTEGRCDEAKRLDAAIGAA